MKSELRDIEPFFGWLPWYNHEVDERSPFHDVEHNLFYYDRSINRIPAHPLWDDMGSESLLLKILFADYQEGYAIIELFGEWNDLYENDCSMVVIFFKMSANIFFYGFHSTYYFVISFFHYEKNELRY